jgi:predicted RND superfamily exporter protein
LEAFSASMFAIVGVLVLFAVFWVLCASVLYYGETTQAEFNEETDEWIYTDESDSPGKISPFQSVPHTLWWAIGKSSR